MKTSRLFTKTLILIVILFGVIATATSILIGWTLYRSLTAEYRSKGIAIAKGVADSSAEILLNRDLATVQAVIDQFDEIGGVGYVFVSDAEGEIVSHTFVPAVPKEVLPLIKQSRTNPVTGDAVTTTLKIERLGNFIHIYAPILAGVAGFVHVGMDQGFIQAQIWSTVAKQQGLIFAIFMTSIVLAYIFVNRISRPLNQLADYTRTLATHDFAAGLNIPAAIEALPQKSKDEIGKLAESFMDMERTLQRYLKDLEETTASKERIESELKIAHEIQMSMVPKTFPPFPDRREIDLYATLVPAREVGGDFYDFFFIDDHRLCFAIGDVSGKGVPASLFMALTKTMFRATGGRQNATPELILSRLNEEICRDNDSCMFVTVFCCVLDVRTGRVEYSNAGHNLPYVLSNGVVTALPKTRGMALGVSESADFHAGQIVLKPGDLLALYTDGVTEAMDQEDQLFSESRLETTLRAVNGLSSKAVIERVVKEVHGFSKGAPQSDDITLLVLGYVGLKETDEGTLSVLLKNDLSELQRMNQIVTEFAERHGLASELVFRLTLVLEEVVTNVISYGYEDSSEHEISVRLSWKDPHIEIEIKDDGRPFNPLEAPPPDMGKPLAEKQVGGLGIHLVREMMDELEYRRENDKNLLILKGKFGRASAWKSPKNEERMS
jgi:sigma-B regulation protein RsbU (phosphoserine phosphatase)